jgi:putative lipoic acid-binding regulatory protein
MSMPSVELLESTHTFPCSYTFKAIGPNEQSFVDASRACAVLVAGEARVEVRYRVSSAGNHGSVTLEVHVEAAAQVHAIYNGLLGVPGVRMVL